MQVLTIRDRNQCDHDAVALGEVLIRFDPVDVPFERASTCRIWHGGGEVNVAEGLASCFGLRATVLTALVDDPIGRSIANQLRMARVDTSQIVWLDQSDVGTDGAVMNGMHFTFRGKGAMPSTTDYYRYYSAIRNLGPEDVDLDTIFGRQGARWAHTGGIFALLSARTSELALRYLRVAGEHGAIRSFDLNYRSKLAPDKEQAQEINRRLVAEVDFLVGNQDDFRDALGYDVADGNSKGEGFEEWLQAYSEALRQVASDYPGLKVIGTQLRSAITADRISWGAVLFDPSEDKIHLAPIWDNVEIADRTGGGDSFASGVIAALLEGRGLADAVDWGAAHGILVQATPGDTTMASQELVELTVARARSGGGVAALR